MTLRQLCALVTLGTAATLPAPAGATNRLSVHAVAWRTHLRLQVTFTVPPPAGICTAEEQVTGPPLCTDQAGVLRVQAYKAGRLLHDETDSHPSGSGYVEIRVPYTRLAGELGRCAAGRYIWKVVLYDGWGRRPLATSRSGSVTLRCEHGRLVHP